MFVHDFKVQNISGHSLQAAEDALTKREND